MTGADYTNIPANAVNVSIDDNDDRGVIVSETSLRFREQLRSSYTIVLNSEPLGTVTIDLAADPATKLTLMVSPPVTTEAHVHPGQLGYPADGYAHRAA